MSASSDSIKHVPGPWKLKGDAHVFFSYTTDSDVQSFSKSFLYEPLESDSDFSKGKFIGGLAAAYVIRYHESPVGPYDELILIPGSFESERQLSGKTVKQRKLRITRIYVSTKATCYNGRENWNIPKHLARFEFKTLSNGAESVVVFREGSSSDSLLFKAMFKPVAYVPAIPASTSIAKYIGLDLTHIQPPLPKGVAEELPGTDKWCRFLPIVSSSKTSLEWWDLKQRSDEAEPLLHCRAEGDEGDAADNWWPDSGRWKIGVKMEDADIAFPIGEHWEF